MNTRAQIVSTVRGENTSHLLFMPRLDIWFAAAEARNTVPAKYQGLSKDEISRKEGWVPYRFMPDFLDIADFSDMAHRCLGLISNRFYLCRYSFGEDIEVKVDGNIDDIRIEYHTPVGSVRGRAILPAEQKRNGVTYHAITEHLVKGPGDYKVLSHIFQGVSVVPNYQPFLSFESALSGNTLCFAAAGMAASPFHHILRDLVDPTTFYMHYQDHQNEMRALSEAMEGYYNQLISVVAQSPVDAVVWGANYDDSLTYPTFFKEEMLPWIQKATQVFHEAGKMVGSHCDGENQRIMHFISESGLDIADSVCPFPMTKMSMKKYCESWGDKITIFGGIPQDFLLPEVTSFDDLKSYMKQLFRDISPGKRIVIGIADAVPPDADFGRLHLIADFIEENGHLPLESGFNPISQDGLKQLSDKLERAERQEEFIENLLLVNKWVNALKPKAGALRDVLLACIDLMEGKDSSTDNQGSPSASRSIKVQEHDCEPQEDENNFGPFNVLKQDILSGNQESLNGHLQEFLNSGISANDLLEMGMLPAMETIGERFKDGTVFIPEVLLSARALNDGVATLEPYLKAGSSGRNHLGTVMIGTVFGDLHDIGKNIVLTMLKGVGFKTIDLGMNVTVGEFVHRVKLDTPDILGLSALLTTTMPEMQKVIRAIEEEGLRGKIKIMVGGAPVSEDFAMKIGADSYARDAGEAVEKAKQLLG